MDRSWLGQWLNRRFGGSQQRPKVRRKKKRTQLDLERLEDRTLFSLKVWTGAFDTQGGTAPPSPFPTTPPLPPTLPQHAGFAQPFWSIPQNWLNNQVPVNGDDILFPSVNSTVNGQPVFAPGTTLNKTILPIVNNAFQTFGALAFYNSIDDIPSLTTINSITVDDDGWRIGYDFGTTIPFGAGYRGASASPGTSTILLNNGITASSLYEAGGVTASSYPTFIDLNFSLPGANQNFTVTNANAILEVGHQAVLNPDFFLSPGGEQPDNRFEQFTGAAGTLTDNSGASGVLKQGLGTLKLSGSNTYTNLTEVDAGVLSVATLPSNPGATTKVLDGASIMIQFSSAISAANTLQIQGTGVTAGPMANGGAIQTDLIAHASHLAALSGTWAGNVVLNADTTFGAGNNSTPFFTAASQFPSPDNLTIGSLSGIVSGPGGIIKAGPGRMSLPGSNTYQGNTTVTSGALQISNNNSLGATTAGTTINSGATLEASGTITTNEPITVNGNGVTNIVNYEPALFGASGSPTLAGPLTVASDSSIGALLTVTLNISGQISGSATLTESFPGTVAITNPNNAPFTGTFATNNGFLLFTAGGAFGNASNVLVNNGGTLEVEGVFTTPVAVPLTLNGLGATGNGALEAKQGTTNVTWAGPIQLSSTAAIGTDLATTTLTITGNISGPLSANLEKTGAGLVTLGGANPNFLGGTTVRAGTLAVSDSLALGPSSGVQVQVFAGGTLDLTNNVNVNKTLSLDGIGVGGLGALQSGGGNNTWSGNINLTDAGSHGLNANGVLQLGAFIGVAPGSQLTLSGIISGISMTIVSNGTLVLAGSSGNAFSGTIVDDTPGLLILNKTSGNAISGSLTVGDTAIHNIQTVTLGGATNGNFSLTFNGQTTNPVLPANATAAQVQAALAALSSVGGVGGTVAVNLLGSTYTVTFGGTLSGSVQPLMTGTGFGGTTVSIAAVLGPYEVVRYGGNNQIADSGGNLSVSASALFDLNGFSDTVEHVTLQASTSDPTPTGLVTTGTGVLTLNGGINVNPTAALAPAVINGNVGIGAGTQNFTLSHSPTLTDDLIITGVISGAANATMDVSGNSSVQSITIAGDSTQHFQLSFNGRTTAPLSFGSTAGTVQAALNGLPTIGGAGGAVSVSLSGTTYTVTFTGGFTGLNVPAIAVATVESANAVETTLGSAGVNEVQTVTTTFAAGAGAGFTLTFPPSGAGSQTTAVLPWGSTAAAVQTALQGLTSIGAGNATVTSATNTVNGVTTTTYTVTFTGTLANSPQPVMTAAADNAASVLQAIVVPGATGTNQIEQFQTSFLGVPAGGFTITFTNNASPAVTSMTGLLPWGASALAVQTAINSMAAVAGLVPPGSVTVLSLTFAGGVLYQITYSGGPLAGSAQNPFIITPVGAASATPAVLVTGGSAGLLLNGTVPNTFAGTTIIHGALDLQDTAGTAIAGPLVIFGTVNDLLDNQVNGAAVTTNITPFSSGVWNLNNHQDTVGALTMNSGSIVTGATGLLILGGNVTTNASTAPATITGNLSLGAVTRTFTVASTVSLPLLPLGINPADLVINGVISNQGGAGFIKAGAGRMQLAGTVANTYTGTTTVNDGTLLLANSALTIPGNLVIGDGTGAVKSAIVQEGIAAVQTITVTGGAGTFTLTFNGKTTGTLAFNATPAAVQAALNALQSIGGVVDQDGIAGSVTVTGSPSNYTVTFGGALGGSAQPAIAGTGSGGASVSVGVVTTGGAANQIASTSAVTFFSDGELRMRDNSGTFSLLTMFGGTINTGVAAGTTLTLQSDVVGGPAPNTSIPVQAAIVGSGSISLGGVSRTFNIANSGSNADMTVGVSILNGGANPAGIVKVGAGSLIFTAANSYAGQTAVNAGFLQIQNGSALGTSGAVTVATAAALQLQGNITVTGTIATLNGDGGPAAAPNGAMENVGGNNTWAGPIVLSSNVSIGADVTSQLTITGVISGVGSSGLTKLGTGTVAFAGSSSNTYTGVTTVNTGTLLLNMSGAGVVAIPGDLVIGDGINPPTADSDIVRLGANGQFNTAKTITVNSTGLLTLDGKTSTIGPLTLNAGDVETRSAEVQSVTLSGSAGGSFTLTFNGATTAALSAGTSAALVQAALNGLSTIGGVGGSVSVALQGGPGPGGVFTVTFGGALLGFQPTMTSAGTGGTIATVNLVTPGVNGALTLPNTVTTLAAAKAAHISGFVTLTVPTTFTVARGTGQNPDTTLVPDLVMNAAVTYSSQLIKTGSGIMVVTSSNGPSSGSGPANVNAGTLLVDGDLKNVAVLVQGGTLGGTGTTGNITASGGTISPGDAPTSLKPGILNVFGNVNLSSAATVNILIVGNSSSAGSDFSQLNVSNGTGQINLNSDALGGSTLTVTVSVSNLAINIPLVILQAGSAGVLNKFSNPITFVSNGRQYTITYNPTNVVLNHDADLSQTVVTSTANPAAFGQPVTLTATVSGQAPGVGTPTGTVRFFDNGVAIAGFPAQTLVNGTAAITVTNFSVGTHPITVVYTPATGSTFTGSTSPVLNEVVNQAQTGITLNGNPNSPLVFGQPVSFTATLTVTAPGGGIPSGTIDLLDNGNLLQSQGVPTTAPFTVTFNLPGLQVGNGQIITARYNGDTNFATSTSPAKVYNVSPDPTTTTLNASVPSPLAFQQTVTFTATVTPNAPGSGTPVGTVDLLDGGTVLKNQNLPASGIVQFTLNTLVVGPGHVIQARFNPTDGNFQTSNSAQLPYVVNPDPTSIALQGSPSSPVVFGQSITFTATVTANFPGSASPTPPTGQVTLQDGLTALQSLPLPANGIVTFTVSNLAIGGPHQISAVYSGDGNFVTSQSPQLPYTVNKDNTTLTLSGNPAPGSLTPNGQLVFGQSLTLTAHVAAAAPGSGTPTGTIQLLDNGTPVTGQSFNVSSTGDVTFTFQIPNPLALGSHSFTVNYSGDGNFNISSSSPPVAYTVVRANTDNTLAASTSTSNPASSSVFGQPVTITVTVLPHSPGAGTPTGTVQLLDNGSPITGQSASLPSNGVVTFTISSLTVGSHSFTDTFTDTDGNFNGSTSSPALGFTVNKANTIETFNGNPGSPTVFGQPVSFTVTIKPVSPGAGNPQGTVTLSDSFNGGPVTNLPTQNLPASGTVTFTFPTSGTLPVLAVGSHHLTATFTDTDNNYNPPGAPAPLSLDYTVNKANTGTTLVGTPASPLVFGQTLTLTATVTATSPGAGAPSGTVDFFDGLNKIGTGNVGSGGVATYTVTPAQASVTTGTPHSFTATYNGDGNFNNSTSTAKSYTINPDPTTTAVTSLPNPTVFGQSTTFTVTVTANAPGAGIPQGTVVLSDTFNGSTTPIGSTQTLNAGSTTFSVSNLAVGTHQLSAAFTDSDGNYVNSTSTNYAQTVNTAQTAVAMQSNANPSVFGQSVAFAVTINVTAPGAGTPQGTVNLKDTFNGVTSTLKSQPLSGGTTTFNINTLAVGNHSLVAQYVPPTTDNSFAASSSPALLETVNKAGATVTVNATPNPATFGQTITLSAAVAATAPGAGSPTGSITFFDGGAALSTQPVGAGGTASVSFSGFSGGNHNITASYSGDGNFQTGTSAAQALVVNPAATSTTITVSANQTVFGQPITVSANVQALPPGSGVVAGTVNLLDNGNAVASQTLSGGAASFTISTLPPGQHSLAVRYISNGNFANSTSAPAGVTVSIDSTTVTLTSSAPRATSGRQVVTFTATVTPTAPGTGTPTGTVTFFDNGASLGAVTLVGGQATFSTSSLTPGTHGITASYTGDANFTGANSAVFGQRMHAPNIYVTGADAGGGPNVVAFDGDSNNVLFNFMAYDINYTGGVRVATGDVNGDGFADILTAPGPGGGPDIHVYDGRTGALMQQFFAFNPNFTGGAYIAAGDVNGDGFADTIIGADSGGGPNVSVFSGRDGTRLTSFFAYDMNFTGGVRVAAGDTNGDGHADLICGAGPGGGPNVTVFSGADGTRLLSFFAYDQRFSNGMFIAAGDINGDGFADIITGPGPQRASLVTLQGVVVDPSVNIGPLVAVFNGLDGTRLKGYFPYDPAFGGGVRVASVLRSGATHSDIVTVAGPGGGPDVRVVDGVTLAQLDQFFAYDPLFTGGLYVAASQL